ncbi:hypothetical protein M1328_00475 [Patescibacteria group bacterium]|nr:hypothetical protein [Patescibacteria group bacterium]
MSEYGSKVCFLSTAYTGNFNELKSNATDEYPAAYLALLARLAQTEGNLLSENAANGMPLCALKMKTVYDLGADLSATLCDNQADATFRACPIPRNLSAWKKNIQSK